MCKMPTLNIQQEAGWLTLKFGVCCAQSCVGLTRFDVVLQVAGQLFGVTVEAADGKAPVWNSDVRFFCIKQDDKPRAYFFCVSVCQPSCSAEVKQPCLYLFQHCIMHITSNDLFYQLLGVAVLQQFVASCIPCCTQKHPAVMKSLLLWNLHTLRTT